MPTARAGGPTDLSHASLSQPEALIAIAERCEQATGPDRDLNIAMLPLVGLRFVDHGHPIGQVCYDENRHAVPMPRFSSSLDAAMTLVPEGGDHFPTVSKQFNGDWQARCYEQWGGAKNTAIAITPALALCAAALRARAAIAADSGTDETSEAQAQAEGENRDGK